MSSKQNPVWYWAETHAELVRRAMATAEDGSYCVYHEGDLEYHTLAYKFYQNDVRYVKILYRDRLFGFTEPLGFESLQDALDAYTSSPTDSGDTLRTPLAKPEIPKPKEEPVKILRKLRHLARLMSQREEELEQIMTCIERLEHDMEEQSREIEAYSALAKMLKSQKEKSYRTSTGFLEDSNLSQCFANNLKLLHERSKSVDDKLEELRKKIEVAERERNSMSLEHTKRLDSVQDLEKELNEYKEVLIEIALYENKVDVFKEFMDQLLAETSTDVPAPQIRVVVQSYRAEAAKRLLKDQPEGTYMVRRKSSNGKLVILVCFTTEKERTDFAEFPVIQSENYFGLEESTCIFEDIHDLVASYTRIPFRVHNDKYGDLTLTQQFTPE